jgi:hypothetical protein
MEAVLTNVSYTVVVESIGSASPVVSKVLAESFGLPQEMVVRKLYNAPAVLFDGVDESVARKAEDVLTTLGLVIRIQRSDEPHPPMPEQVEIALHIDDALSLPRVCAQLAEFLGCPTKDALNLLLQEPAVVMGGASPATAEAIASRVDAEVLISYPKRELYTLILQKDNHTLHQQVQHILNQAGIKHDFRQSTTVRDLDYKTSQDIWRRHHSAGNMKIANQAFERYEVVLKDAENRKPEYQEVLLKLAGMPVEVTEEILGLLPVQLHESVAASQAVELVLAYQEAGLSCVAHQLPVTQHLLQIEEMTDAEAAAQVLQQVFEPADLPRKAPWQSKVPMSRMMARYLVAQLEAVGCAADYVEVRDGR